ncbi:MULTISPECIES: single-stranded DNA-binding protein [unclassified Streptomyces]|uniref:single-stranded DNA-binding protein n=1 Tax=unclassified Streptomyces TaxID=2593676 RepID=UPI0037F5807F
MNDTLVTVVGNVATKVEFRESPSGGVARFRIAATPRRWDRERGGWADGRTSFYTVWAWRALGVNVTSSVVVGEQLLVHGRLRVREEQRDGQWRTSVDIEAVAVGHDLARGTSAFRRVTRKTPFLTERHEGGAQGQEGGGEAASGGLGSPWEGGGGAAREEVGEDAWAVTVPVSVPAPTAVL